MRLKKKADIVGRGQTWHRPEDVEAALDKSLEDLGLGYGKYENPYRVLACFKEVGTPRSWILARGYELIV